jgi:hypothetical protein
MSIVFRVSLVYSKLNDCMPYKDLQKRKEYKQIWFQNNKERVSEKNKLNTKNFRKTNPERSKLINKKADQKRNTTPEKRFSRLKIESKRRGLSLEISLEQYKILVNTNCYYCSTDLNREKGYSLDRIDNNNGYELNNVLPCCGICNSGRNKNFTVKEWKVAMAAILEFRNRK